MIGKVHRLKLDARSVSQKSSPKVNTENQNTPEVKTQKTGRKARFKALLIDKTFPEVNPTKIEDLTDKMKNLITMPDKPDKKGKYSTTRDQVYTRGENPLTFYKTANERGFLQKDLIFYRFHVVPPLLFEENPELEKIAYNYEKKYCRDWIGYFMASGFMPVLKKL